MLSLWTSIPHFRISRSHLVIQTLSVALARNAFDELQYVTDHQGAALGRLLGWEFDEVDLTLQSFPSEGLDHIWALGKLVALSIQRGPAIHLDGDVLLSKRLPDRVSRAKLIAQSPDWESHYSGSDMEAGFRVSGLPRIHRKFNAGLIGGADHHLVRAWAHYALDLAAKFRHCPLNGTTTSMLVEQVSLGCFSARAACPVETLLGDLPSVLEDRETGYQHLVGAAKRDPRHVTRAELRLQREFPELWEKFRAGWALIAHRASTSISHLPASCVTSS